jgi:hypothetical protein
MDKSTNNELLLWCIYGAIRMRKTFHQITYPNCPFLCPFTNPTPTPQTLSSTTQLLALQGYFLY